MENNAPFKKIYFKLYYNAALATGFTLVEVMVAMVVLSIGLFAAASMQIYGLDANASVNRNTQALNLAQSQLEFLLALEYTHAFTDVGLTDDRDMAVTPEPFTDANGNGLWDIKEPYTDLNKNGMWDPPHQIKGTHTGHTVSWSVYDDTAGNGIKFIRVYVTPPGNGDIVVLTCAKSME